MSAGPTSYFLLSYHLEDHRVTVEDFGGDSTAAAAAYSAREHERRDVEDIEVVLVGADSLDTVRRTHSHYFAGSGDLVAAVERDLRLSTGAR